MSTTVLIIDDDPVQRRLAEAMVRRLGFQAQIAENGHDGLNLLRSGESVDVVLLDLVMPGGMDGLSLAREAHRRHPTLKILLTTGYAEASLERTGLARPEFDILNKPYRRAELIRRVRAAIDAPNRS